MYTKIQIEKVYVYQGTAREGVCIPRYRQKRCMYTKIQTEKVYVYQDTDREGLCIPIYRFLNKYILY